MHLHEAKQLATKMVKEYLGDSWSFQFNRRKSSFGLCSYSKKTIQLSAPLTQIETREHVLNTIQHEIAHALTPGDGHGKKWRAMCKKLGMKTVSRASTLTPGVKDLDPKWVIVCPRGTVVKRYNRSPNSTTLNKLHRMYVQGRREETYGKLTILKYEHYKRMYG